MVGGLAAEAGRRRALGGNQRLAIRSGSSLRDLHRLDAPGAQDDEVLRRQCGAGNGQLSASGTAYGLGQDGPRLQRGDGDPHSQFGFGARPSEAMREETICLSKGLTT